MNKLKRLSTKRKFNILCLLLSVGYLCTIFQAERRLGAVSSATGGKVFDNEKIRTFHGIRLSLDPNQQYAPIPTYAEPCQRWGVVTTIFDPSEAISRVASMPSWCLVIVPDLKTPHDYMDKLVALQADLQAERKGPVELREASVLLENVFYFSIDKQREWEEIIGPFGEFVKSTPWKHFCRKNLGYLFAIIHGAEYIFDFDDDNFVKVDANGVPLQILPEDHERDADGNMVLNQVGIIMQGANVFNHHPIMGASVEESWARGFPIDLIKDKHTRGLVAYDTDIPFVSAKKEIGVIQFLADGNPDIDAMHRISKPLPINFPLDEGRSVLVPTHAYAPYNAQATIHTKNALWATLLPGTVPGRVSDIWRSYFAQCIFHDSGLQLVFSPPKIVQERNEHDYLGDLDAEQDLYVKSGKLVEFLSEWDSEEEGDTIPKRMERLWIDLYERGYIELDDIYAVQMWLGALHQAGYKFPELKRKFRNVAVMGQFNYADSPTIVDDIVFWTQKQREHFKTVVATGPFTDEHMSAFQERSIEARSNHNLLEQQQSESTHRSGSQIGFFSPLENHMNTLLEFKDSPSIEGVLYAHDDAILNVTELSKGEYPFPSEDIIGSDVSGQLAWRDARSIEDVDFVNRFAYRIFPDGNLEDFKKSSTFNNINELFETTLIKWGHTPENFCGGGQTEMAKDVESSQPYLEEDGSLLFSPFVQADFLYVPTKYADEFAQAAQFHLKHGVFIECAYGTVVDMVRRKTGADVRVTKLCTTFNQELRGTPESVQMCKNSGANEAIIHPFKISKGYDLYGNAMDMVQ